MAREIFWRKYPGDELSANHVNKLSAVARRAAAAGFPSNLAMVSSSVDGYSGPPPHWQQKVIVTAISSQYQYSVQLRYYNSSTGAWFTDTTNSFDMDSSELELELEVGEIVPAYFDNVRQAFIPLASKSSSQCRILVDYHGGGNAVADIGFAQRPIIHFALEQSLSGDSHWAIVNNRTYTVNANFDWLNGDDEGEVSGTGIYTFMFTGDGTNRYLRVACFSELGMGVTLSFIAIRIEAKCNTGIAHTVGGVINARESVAGHLFPVAAVQNAVQLQRPYFVLLPDGERIQVVTPIGQQWTYECEISCKFSLEEVSSSSTSLLSSSSWSSHTCTSESSGSESTESSSSTSSTSSPSSSSASFSSSSSPSSSSWSSPSSIESSSSPSSSSWSSPSSESSSSVQDVTCPSVCTECPDSYKVTISNLTDFCDCVNGTWTIEGGQGDCQWTFQQTRNDGPNCPSWTIEIRLQCVNNRWELRIRALSIGPNSDDTPTWETDRPNQDGCPPEGNWTMGAPTWEPGSDECTGAENIVVELTAV